MLIQLSSVSAFLYCVFCFCSYHWICFPSLCWFLSGVLGTLYLLFSIMHFSPYGYTMDTLWTTFFFLHSEVCQQIWGRRCLVGGMISDKQDIVHSWIMPQRVIGIVTDKWREGKTSHSVFMWEFSAPRIALLVCLSLRLGGEKKLQEFIVTVQ